MRCTYRAVAAEPVDQVWALLRDVDGIAAALPGTTLASDGEQVAGSLKCSLGSTQITYRIGVRVEVADDERHRAVIVVTGKEARGSGTLTATLIVAVQAEDLGSSVSVSGDIAATGRGESANADAWSRVIGRLVDAAVPGSTPTPLAADPAAASPARDAAPRPALAVAPDTGDYAPDYSAARDDQRQLIGGLVVVVLLLLIRSRRRRRRAQGGADDGE